MDGPRNWKRVDGVVTAMTFEEHLEWTVAEITAGRGQDVLSQEIAHDVVDGVDVHTAFLSTGKQPFETMIAAEGFENAFLLWPDEETARDGHTGIVDEFSRMGVGALSAQLRIEMADDDKQVLVGLLRRLDRPGSMSSEPVDGPREVYTFGWLDGQAGVWVSEGGVDVAVGTGRTTLSTKQTKLSDLSEPFELFIWRGPASIKLTLTMEDSDA